MPEYALRVLFLVPLLFVASIPTYFLNFNFFYHSSLFPFYTCSIYIYIYNIYIYIYIYIIYIYIYIYIGACDFGKDEILTLPHSARF